MLEKYRGNIKDGQKILHKKTKINICINQLYNWRNIQLPRMEYTIVYSFSFCYNFNVYKKRNK